MRTSLVILALTALAAPLGAEDKSPTNSATATARAGVRILSIADLEPPEHVVTAMEARRHGNSLAGILVYE